MRLVTLIFLSLIASNGGVTRQNKRCEDTERLRSRYVERVKKHPLLGVDYERVIKFKLASRKASYRLGDLISLDLAMLNISDAPLFLQELSAPSIKLTIQDEKGIQIGVFDFEVYQLGVSTKLYDVLNPHGAIAGTVQLLVGCKEQEAFAEAKNKLLNESQAAGTPEDRNMFERNLFVSWGNFCLNASHPGKYTVTAETTNEFVIGSPCEPNIRTAVGKIRSTPLTITVAE